MSLGATRQCIDAILDGSINDSEFVTDDVFGFEVPTTIGDIGADVLVPRNSWADGGAYDAQAKKLAQMFVDNYGQYQEPGMTDYSAHGPRA